MCVIDEYVYPGYIRVNDNTHLGNEKTSSTRTHTSAQSHGTRVCVRAIGARSVSCLPKGVAFLHCMRARAIT